MPELPRVAVLLSKRLPTCDTWRQSFCQMLAPFCATFSLKYDVLVVPAQKRNVTRQQGRIAGKVASNASSLSLYYIGSLHCAPLCLGVILALWKEICRYVKRSGYPRMAWMPMLILFHPKVLAGKVSNSVLVHPGCA